MKKFDVAALGSGNIDIFLSIPSLPTRGGKVVGTRLGEQAGGTVANSACAMGQLVSMWYLFHVWAMIIQPRSFLMDLKNIM
ncbi:hypothetical protein O5839_09535 [Escherichia coli]|nr:hypothetical protein [Escherichia coli]